MNFAYGFPRGFVTPLSQAPTPPPRPPPLQAVPSANPYFFSPTPPSYHSLPRFSVPLLSLWAFQIDSGITSEACIPSYTSYEPFYRLHKKLEKGRKEPKTSIQLHVFHYANNMLCCLHQIHPTITDSLILLWDKVTP